MAANLNKVLLIGNLTRDPELKQTPRGTAVCDLGLAINDSYKAQDGTIKEVTTFVDVEVWGRTAENCKQYLTKGRPVFIEGQLKLDTWETQTGEKKSKMRVRAERVQFLGGGQGGGGGGQGGGSRSGGNYSSNEQRPAASTGRTSAPAPSVSEDAPPVRDEDDIPF